MPALTARFLQACCLAPSPTDTGDHVNEAHVRSKHISSGGPDAAGAGGGTRRPQHMYLEPAGVHHTASFGSLQSDDSGGGLMTARKVGAHQHTSKHDAADAGGSSSTDTGPTTSTVASSGSMVAATLVAATHSSGSSLGTLKGSSSSRPALGAQGSSPLPSSSNPSLPQAMLPSSLSLPKDTQMQPRARPPSMQQLAATDLMTPPAHGAAPSGTAPPSSTGGASDLQRCSNYAMSHAVSTPLRLHMDAGIMQPAPSSPFQAAAPSPHSPLPKPGRRDTTPSLPAMEEEAPVAVVTRVSGGNGGGAVGALRRAFTLGRSTSGRVLSDRDSTPPSLSHHLTPASSLNTTTADSVFDAALRVAAAQATLHHSASVSSNMGAAAMHGDFRKLSRSVHSEPPRPAGSGSSTSTSSGSISLAGSRSSRGLSAAQLRGMDGGARWGASGGLLGASVQRLEGRAAHEQSRVDAASAAAVVAVTPESKPARMMSGLLRTLSGKQGAGGVGAKGCPAIPREDEAAARTFGEMFLQALKECNPRWGSDPIIGTLLHDNAVMVALDKQQYSGRTAIIRRLNQGMEQFLKMIGLDVAPEKEAGASTGEDTAAALAAQQARQAQMAAKAGHVEASLELTIVPPAPPKTKGGKQQGAAGGAAAGVVAVGGQTSVSVIVVTYTFKAGLRRFKLQDRFKVRGGRIMRLRRLRL